MTSETHTSPQTPQGQDKSSGSVPVVPELHRLVTRLALVYEVGQPYPNLAETDVKAVPARVASITEGADGSGPIYFVRCTPDDPDLAGFEFVDVIAGDAVRMVGGLLSEKDFAEEEEDYEDDADAGTNVQRIVVPLGIFGANAYEVGALVPQLPAPYTVISGRIEKMYRDPGGALKIKVRAPIAHPLFEGAIWVLEVFEYHNCLELLPTAEADDLVNRAVAASLAAVERAIDDGEGGDDDGEGGDDDGEEGDDPEEGDDDADDGEAAKTDG